MLNRHDENLFLQILKSSLFAMNILFLILLNFYGLGSATCFTTEFNTGTMNPFNIFAITPCTEDRHIAGLNIHRTTQTDERRTSNHIQRVIRTRDPSVRVEDHVHLNGEA